MQEQVSRKDIYTLIGNQSKFLKSKIIEYENKIYTNVAVARGTINAQQDAQLHSTCTTP
jgi:hypothetical protein